MSAENWDFDTQKAATFYSVAQFLAEEKVPEGAIISLELFFIPAGENDREAFLKALKTFGYAGEPDNDGIIVRVDNVEFGAGNIWLHEERTTKLALSRGYEPDGWGFLEP